MQSQPVSNLKRPRVVFRAAVLLLVCLVLVLALLALARPAQAEPEQTFYVSTEGSGTVDGIDYTPDDILEYDPNLDTWSMFFDGEEHGLDPAKHNIFGIHISNTVALTPDLYLSFYQNKVNVPDVGNIEGHDILHYDGISYTLFFDGGDVGLTTVMEKLDSIVVLDGSFSPIGDGSCDHYLLLSMFGEGRVTDVDNNPLRFSGEDILGFCLTNSGSATAGFWHLFLDGSDQGMPNNSTYSLAAHLEILQVFLTTLGTFNVDTAFGGHSMVFEFDTVTDMFFGPSEDFTDDLTQRVDALDIEFFLP